MEDVEGKNARRGEGGGGEKKEETAEVGGSGRFTFDYKGEVPRR